MSRFLLRAFGILVLGFSLLPAETGRAIDYDVLYVRQARFGDNTNTIWPEVFHPARLDPGADLYWSGEEQAA